MANIMDYLDWRGDLLLSQVPFNEVDNLILSQMSYVDFEKIVPSLNSVETITIKEASEIYFSMYTKEEIDALLTLTKMSAYLLKKMAQCDRFANLKLSNYINIIDSQTQKQFSAITVYLDEDTDFIAYRGTDNTIVGWKENFNMTFMSPVPAQIEAVSYLNAIGQKTQKKLIIGGHSKGGNLAVYAAVKCCSNIKDRILEVFNNDGPGFHHDVISCAEYKDMIKRVKTIIPQSSIVGMMLEHEEEYVIVKSSKSVLLQHDPMSWEVLGNQFVYERFVTKESRILDGTLKALLDKMDESQRGQFVDAMFMIFDATNVETIADLTQDRWRKITEIIKVISSMDQENKKILKETIKLFFNEGNRIYKESKLK
ncbi:MULTISPECIES: DUF2974 domain-containing protein [Bacillaceae]|uniref:DUF2974 domain-containing protein n=1 Tax=Evansella alkalicola TaxID=745819 RepID=A0ABS6JQP1_9BACI|nr:MULTISPECIES: DUF2974 domain-containing protein [Bacillaceae]MBU9720044.1 DUF2974 domain-containing protein [Bacillus alkalicola]